MANSPLMKRALLLSLALAGMVLPAAPGRADGWFHATYREGIALAREGRLSAGVSIGDLNAWASSSSGTGGRRAYVCLYLEDTVRRLQAAGDCVDASPVISPGLDSASISTSIPMEIRRVSDGSAAGTTTLSVDVRWTSMSPPLPRLYGSFERCGWTGYRPDSVVVNAEPFTQLVGSGIAEGTLSSPDLGTVHFRRNTLTWDALLIEGVVTGVQASMRTEQPGDVEPGCRRTFYNTLPPRLDL